ncbi:MAG TPA: sulfotransferase [Stellaceae bacterium]
MPKKRPPRVKTHDRAVVVLGAPRSGTTLVATALGAHAGIAMLSEDCDGAMFTFVGGKLPGVKLCTPNHVDIERRWHWFYEPLRRIGWLRHHFNYRLPRSKLSLRDMAARAELKIVCILREPQANIAAIRRRAERSESVSRDMLRRTYGIYEKLSREPLMEPHFLSYEKLIGDPEAQLRGLCQWLDLPFDAAMLDAPRLNPAYPEATFRADKATAVVAELAAGDAELAGLHARYRQLIALAQ